MSDKALTTHCTRHGIALPATGCLNENGVDKTEEYKGKDVVQFRNREREEGERKVERSQMRENLKNFLGSGSYLRCPAPTTVSNLQMDSHPCYLLLLYSHLKEQCIAAN